MFKEFIGKDANIQISTKGAYLQPIACRVLGANNDFVKIEFADKKAKKIRVIRTEYIMWIEA